MGAESPDFHFGGEPISLGILARGDQYPRSLSPGGRGDQSPITGDQSPITGANFIVTGYRGRVD